jgi:hypothetical protein
MKPRHIHFKFLNQRSKILREIKTEIAVIGGSTGGVAAALAALKMGRRVFLSEETDWIGGQFTSQAVPPDEHPWIESFGRTRSYARLREDVREYYRRWYPLTKEARETPNLNPGGGWVSRLCHEPRVALAILQSYLLPFETSGQLQLELRSTPVAATTDGDRVTCVTLQSEDGEHFVVQAEYFLDATELGDLLELANVEFVMGAEAQSETGEPHAPLEAQPLNQQSVSYCYAMSHHPGENHVIDKPAEYSFWQSYQAPFWPDKNLSWVQTHPVTMETRTRCLFPHQNADGWEPLWSYRKIVNAQNFEPNFASDVTLVNWPQIDYWLGPLVGVSKEEKKKHLQAAKVLSLCFLYWMQTEAPRYDGGSGFPGLKIRGDITGTKDGLAKYPYIRESRRIRAEFVVKEQHVASALRPDGAEKFSDSVGVGCYRIDLHPSTGKSGDGSDGDNYIDVGSWPFQIPLGSLLPVRVENLLPACKNLGVTHITNGCYRLHPVEWNIGEAAGALAAYCLQNNLSPRAVRNDQARLGDFQKVLTACGVELDWPQLHAV